MKYIPILFSTPMVQAILEGRKTVTRRIINPQPVGEDLRIFKEHYHLIGDQTGLAMLTAGDQNWETISHKSRFGNIPFTNSLGTHFPGDILWVRETWAPVDTFPDPDIFGKYLYKSMGDTAPRWKPSIFMPKDACRIFLQIDDIKVERLRDISEQDAKNEGVISHTPVPGDGETIYRNYLRPTAAVCYSAKKSFQSLWEKINGSESWLNNPWVWVVSFKRIDKPADFVPQGTAAQECDANQAKLLTDAK